MNSLVASLRSSCRLGPAPRTALAAARPYSTAPAPEPSTSSSSSSPPPRSGVDQLKRVIAGVQASKAPRAPSPADLFAGRGSAHDAASRFLFNSSQSPRSLTARPATPEQTWQHTPPVPYSLPVTTTSARSFAVRDGNVARAYRTLNRVLQENNVRRELKRQERFESPSNKRVRLNSERHRRRFKVAVGKAVSLALRTKDL
ncbi:hypothetical protein JCM3770_000124 [Rhodotorula araucariae]